MIEQLQISKKGLFMENLKKKQAGSFLPNIKLDFLFFVLTYDDLLSQLGSWLG